MIGSEANGYFNPRPREEGDILQIADELKKLISIHALVKRATLDCLLRAYQSEISIHALVKRATAVTVTVPAAVGISIHALVKRATKQLVQKVKQSKFQSTPS